MHHFRMKSSRLYLSKLQKKKSLSFDRHRSGRELKFVGDENAIIDEPHHSSNEEEEGADIDANEMTSRYVSVLTLARYAF